MNVNDPVVVRRTEPLKRFLFHESLPQSLLRRNHYFKWPCEARKIQMEWMMGSFVLDVYRGELSTERTDLFFGHQMGQGQINH